MAERADLRDLYERYGRAVHRRCMYFLRNTEDAEDAMHDVFVKVVERYDDFRGQASPLTWITRITSNHCLNIIRSRKAAWRDRFEQSAKVAHGARGPDDYGRMERAQMLHSILPKIPKDLQEVAVYYFVDEMSQQDAANAAGCSVPTLRKRLRRFIELARKELKGTDITLVFGESPV